MGSLIGLGAFGITLSYSILRFANFAHGEFIAWGTYMTLVLTVAISTLFGGYSGTLGPLSFGWPLLAAGMAAAALTGGLAVALDYVLFSKLRSKGNAIVMVMASFGASRALRSFLEFVFTSRPAYFTRDIQMAVPVGLGIRLTPAQFFLIFLTM